MFALGRALLPIHFGRADGVECALLREACHSEFDKLVSLASHSEDRRFRRMGNIFFRRTVTKKYRLNRFSRYFMM